MQGLDEEEYDALPEAEKEKLMERYRVKLRQMKVRYELVEADADHHFLFPLEHKLTDVNKSSKFLNAIQRNN